MKHIRLRFFRGPHSNSGMSLLAIMVALGIGAIAIYSAMQLIQTTSLASKRLRTQTDVMTLRSYALESLDCATTITNLPTSCNRTPMSVSSTHSSRPELVRVPSGANYSKVGQIELRAFCDVCATCTNGKKILIEYRANSQWKDINRGIPISCVLP